MNITKQLLVVVFSLFVVLPTKANFAYYGIEPDIVTNYIGPTNNKLGYIRVTLELMLEDAMYIEVAEHHSPLLRATAIEIFGSQPEDRVKSLTGREEIRLSCLRKLRKLMKAETGNEVIKDVIFTKYLYQG